MFKNKLNKQEYKFQFKTQLFEMPYFWLTAENTYFIVFNITCKNEALLYIVEYIHTNWRFCLLRRLEFICPMVSEGQTVHKNKSSEGGA